MQLSELRKRTSQGTSLKPRHGDEELVVDRRDAMKPADMVERKLRLLLRNHAALQPGDPRWAQT